MKNSQENPLLKSYDTPFDTIPFDKLKTEHFMPAIEKGLEIARENIKKIKENTDQPNFENTVLALETSGELLGDVTTIYFNLYSAESDDEFKALAQKISPMLAEFSTQVHTDSDLYKKVEAVYKNQDGLNDEQKRLIEHYYKEFVRNGASLPPEKKKKLEEIDKELAMLSPKFSQNVLKATNTFELHITDEKEIEGLPKGAKEAAAFTAKKKGKDNGWLFTLQAPSVIPVIKYAKNRELRETISRAFRARAFKDEFDNREILKRIAQLRQERAELLGYDTHAQYVLEERMAETPENVMEFLDRIYSIAYPAAKKEKEELQKLAKETDNIDELQGWDAAYYSEKLKKIKYDFDEEELRPYFKVENVIDGLFKVAETLYNIKFKQIENIPTYHEEVKVFEVKDKDGSHLGLLYMDLFPRETKRGGAWMTNFKTQGLSRGEVRRPHVGIMANLTPSTDINPSLLELSEVQTLFHEFGHALHGLLSDCTYTTLASPNVYWDFVELPSQIMENWTLEKEALEMFARHYKTGKRMPDELIKKMKKAKNFNKGNANVRQLSFGYLDMAWHAKDPRKIEDVAEYEDEVLKKTKLYPKVEGTNISCSFGHIFAGGYSSGYYSYKWAEVLEADSFQLFKEMGIFNQEIADSFRKNILSKGNTAHPMELYVKFRGRQPDPDAMLKRDGLIK
ncbi:MAG TPA: M3 family peptidase [Candidatus Cloacimonetes bacterium]|nr:M3 family peptidase [Candidatus Cloacimonadota bacterium]HEX37855.1 M3 family peptidase [Candidatus Cloacimonadota bacterium]